MIDTIKYWPKYYLLSQASDFLCLCPSVRMFFKTWVGHGKMPTCFDIQSFTVAKPGVK